MNKPASHLLKLSLCSLLSLPCLASATDSEVPTDPPPTPKTCLTVIKEVSPDGLKPWFDANTEAEAVIINSASKYRIRIYNCGEEKILNAHVSDPLLGIDSYIGGARPGSDFVFEYPAGDVCKDRYGLVKNTATVSGTGEETATYIEVSDDAWVNCGEQPPMGGEGCTPGYWKQSQHFDSWPSAYTPDMLFSAVFGQEIAVRDGRSTIVDPTLMQALEANGGNINAAARHVVAALLNAASTGVSYDMTAGGVIDLFNANYPDGDIEDMKDRLEMYNEQGCPLN